MGTWIGFVFTVPMTVLSGLMVLQLYRRREESLTRMSLRSRDIRIAIQLMMAGFAFEGVPRLVDLVAGGSVDTVSAFAGLGSSLSLSMAFIIVNGVIYGPGNPVYRFLPSRPLE